ncbi:MAG: 5-formyltetrahydrofolate cyclo-ligase [Enhygromyxa sp.]
MQAPDPAKQALRKQLLRLRRELTQIEERSAALTRHLLEHPLWQSARGVAAFVGVRNEPDTAELLEQSVAAGKVVWLPRLTGPGLMRFWPCADFSTLEPGKMGLREPPIVEEGVVAPGPEHEVDLVLVPGLGFGRDGARIGFGAGHYDRALGTRRGAAKPVLCGVCFSEFLDPFGEQVPMVEHDVPMHYVVTEAGVERCGA